MGNKTTKTTEVIEYFSEDVKFASTCGLKDPIETSVDISNLPLSAYGFIDGSWKLGTVLNRWKSGIEDEFVLQFQPYLLDNDVRFLKMNEVRLPTDTFKRNQLQVKTNFESVRTPKRTARHFFENQTFYYVEQNELDVRLTPFQDSRLVGTLNRGALVFVEKFYKDSNGIKALIWKNESSLSGWIEFRAKTGEMTVKLMVKTLFLIFSKKN